LIQDFGRLVGDIERALIFEPLIIWKLKMGNSI